MSYQEQIYCPKCLQSNGADDLEQNTAYGCWSGEEVSVNCLHCDHYFEVRCEHRGYSPCYDTFDMNSFIEVHNISIPDNLSRTFVNSYFKELVECGKTKLVVMNDTYRDSNPKWAAAYEFAIKEWERIQASFGNHEKEQETEAET